MKKYKTNTGVYAESQLAVVVWKNPKSKTSKKSRSLETMTSDNSVYPMAFPIELLGENPSWARARLVKDDETFFMLIFEATKSAPLIVPLPVAESTLGWDNFYIATEYEV